MAKWVLDNDGWTGDWDMLVDGSLKAWIRYSNSSDMFEIHAPDAKPRYKYPTLEAAKLAAEIIYG